MAELTTIRRGDILVPADSSSLDELRKLPQGKPLRSKLAQPRNYEFHKLVFSLIKLTHDMWEPDTLVSEIEKNTVIRLAEFMESRGVDRDACCRLSTEFLSALRQKRETYDLDKSFDAFRDFVTVKAGYYREIITPSGPRREPVSWSFSSMDESAFRELYRAVFGVCWDIALSQHFASEAEAENAINSLMGYS